ncbi:MAG: hypothetical protein M1828_006363 [Chrysothrix sp. TS-e1954]|nr:MAG: hypothetical protein M1828_006363 [Chrysothrix sp. TS-e1954]
MPPTNQPVAPQALIPDAHDDDLEPDTPAPIFAVRAFKQAIFGTPAPKVRPPRKPISATDISSPSKRPPGILLTPGTGGNNRRKTVSFGGPGDAARQLQKGPGAFPSLWEEKDAAKDADKKRASKLNQDLQNKQDLSLAESELQPAIAAATRSSPRMPKRKSDPSRNADITASTKEGSTQNNKPKTSTHDMDSVSNDAEDATVTLTSPHSRSGRFWKSEYDNYARKSSLELRKFIKKEQVAKKWAKERDSAALKMEEELRHEQKKVARLEREVEEYNKNLKAFDEKRENSEKDRNGKDKRMDVDKMTLTAHLIEKMMLERVISALTESNAELKEENQKLRKAKAPQEIRSQQKADALISLSDDDDVAPTQVVNRPIKPMPSSDGDIWADAGLGAAVSKDQANTAVSSFRRLPRRPLTTTTGNATILPTMTTANAQPLKPTADRSVTLQKNESTPKAINIGSPKEQASTHILPLQSRPNGNLSASNASISDAKIKGLTVERKEAARLRLEAKRRSRVDHEEAIG